MNNNHYNAEINSTQLVGNLIERPSNGKLHFCLGVGFFSFLEFQHLEMAQSIGRSSSRQRDNGESFECFVAYSFYRLFMESRRGWTSESSHSFCTRRDDVFNIYAVLYSTCGRLLSRCILSIRPKKIRVLLQISQ